MAKPSSCIILMLSSLFIALQISGNYATKETELDAEEDLWSQNLCRNRNEKLAKIRFYLQDALGGENTTVYEVANASITDTSPTAFGQVRVFDDQLTVTPDRKSPEIGRAQGMVISSDFSAQALTTVLNFVFTAGEYKGSTISVLGRNQLDKDIREMSVVGGTGDFRFARGYVTETTYSEDKEAEYDVQEFTIYATYPSHST